MSFGDLRPSHISVDNQKQEYKLLDRLNDPSTILQANVNHILSDQPLYCSPAIFDAIKTNKKTLEHDPFKSDSFSLGLILLEIGTMQSVQKVYNHDDGAFNQDLLNSSLDHFKQKF